MSTTGNLLLEAPAHGADVDTWDEPVNRDWVAIDGLLGGLATIGISNINVTLDRPSGTPAPTPGPFQAQNRILRFTGAQTGNVQVNLPLATKYTIQNLTVGSSVLSFRSTGGGAIVAVPGGAVMSIINDGTDCFFCDMSRPGSMEFWGGVNALPAWVNACSTPPYILCNGSISAFSSFPYLGPILGNSFGGNGITTFGVPDLRGRVPLAYDNTGTRITFGGCGIAGNSMGAAGGVDSYVLQVGEIPSHRHTLIDPGHAHEYTRTATVTTVAAGGTSPSDIARSPEPGTATSSSFTGMTMAFTGGGGSHPNVQPAQVAGIWVVKT